VILPPFRVFGLAVHGLTVHLFWTAWQRAYSPDLVTSLLYWVVTYLVVRYGYTAGLIPSLDMWVAAETGLCCWAGL